MAYRCKVYRQNDQGGLDSQIVDSADIPKGWTPNPADFDKPAPKKRGKKAVENGDN